MNETSWEILSIILFEKASPMAPEEGAESKTAPQQLNHKMNTFDYSNYFLLLIVCKKTFNVAFMRRLLLDTKRSEATF